jgi:hypothetical protein
MPQCHQERLLPTLMTHPTRNKNLTLLESVPPPNKVAQNKKIAVLIFLQNTVHRKLGTQEKMMLPQTIKKYLKTQTKFLNKKLGKLFIKGTGIKHERYTIMPIINVSVHNFINPFLKFQKNPVKTYRN